MANHDASGRLAGKVALIFGAGPNIGGTCAHFMAREGAKVALVGTRPETAGDAARFLRARNFEALALTGDAGDERDVEKAVAATLERYGAVDTMVYVAGRQYRQEIVNFDLAGWDLQIRGYLTGAMLATKHCARAMIGAKRPGSIIYVLSDAAHQGEPGNSCYCAAKAGLLNFARAAAMEFARHDIRVNSVSPTFMEQNFWMFPPEFMNPPSRAANSVTADDFLQGIPLARFCTTSDVANAVIFLAADESTYLTAVDIPLDGGARAKYWPWTPGKYTGITSESYAKMKPNRYGVGDEDTK
ncbi:MAG TPA: SDR family oxidoreductase [Candidatus Binataceae bacterium]|nr:SDR family oxidoreductase [Candidatus Binataceae bacterium]